MIYRVGLFLFFMNFSWVFSQESLNYEMIERSSSRKLVWNDQGSPKSNRDNTIDETHGRIKL